MFKVLFILFLTVPLVEIYLLIEIGSRIGATNTVILIILTAIIGTFLLRQQGLSTLIRVQQSLEQKKLPATELIGGLMLVVAGVLLLTPGFFTDAIGFLCLIPPLRLRIANILLAKLLRARQQRDDVNVTIEGEFWEENRNRDQHNRLH